MKYAITFLVAAAFSLGITVAFANQSAIPAPQIQQPTEVSEVRLEKFAEIYVDVETTRNAISNKLQEVENPQKAQKIQEQMRDEIIAIIENHGWTLDDYNMTAQAIASDKALKEQVLQLVNEKAGS